jgi:D-alanyl-lipoteichoic acid acyltransferase DltB (MBOAT superfamily)
MLFDSLSYFIFFPIVVAAFFTVPSRWRWTVLLAASVVFYAWWKISYLLLLFFATSVGFGVGRLLARETRPGRRRALLALALAANLGSLFFFKYAHFFFPGVRGLSDVALPVGISFYTFQTLGYAIDVYREQYEPETHFGRFALFVAFFPHLVAGPIMRGSQLLPQFREAPRWNYDRAVSGAGLVLWGLFKKVVIADRAAHYVDVVYGEPHRFQGATVVVATYLFAFQLYGDFSGYTDIAIGSARVLGFELPQNFDRPYASASIMQFWRRWHMTFSTWLNDYVYIPLGLALGRLSLPVSSKTSRMVRTFACVAVVFLISGLWHGARGTYVAWGAFMGMLMVGSLALAALWKRARTALSKRSDAAPLSPAVRALANAFGVVLTFHLVCASLLLFRAPSLERAYVVASQIPLDHEVSVLFELTRIGPAPADAVTLDLAVLVGSIAVMEIVQWIQARGVVARLPPPVRLLAWSALSAWVLLAAVQTHSPFIYFAF